jgi:hypothetical protein
MGLLSKIKKGAKKVFAKVGKVFNKVFGNKWAQIGLLAISVFAPVMAAAQAGWAAGGAMGALKAGVGELVTLAAKTLTAPIDLVAQGISGVGTSMGANSITAFGNSLSASMQGIVDAASNIFTPVATAAEGAAGLAGASEAANAVGDSSMITQNSVAETLDGAGVAEQMAGTAKATEAANGLPGMVDAAGKVAQTAPAQTVIGNNQSLLQASPDIFGATKTPQAASGGIEEVTVTARKKEESLQDAPISISAFSGEGLEQRGVTSLAEIENFTPSMTFQNNPSFSGASSSSSSFFDACDASKASKFCTFKCSNSCSSISSSVCANSRACSKAAAVRINAS